MGPFHCGAKMTLKVLPHRLVGAVPDKFLGSAYFYGILTRRMRRVQSLDL
jgi:hypothetical protein